MNSRRLINGVISFCLLWVLSACSGPITIYHHHLDRERILDGEIWNGDLQVFFSDREDIERKVLRSRMLAKELNRILTLIKKEQLVTVFDDNYYEYVFIINSRDTLYTNNEFAYWKYRNLTMGKIDNELSSLLE